MVMRTILPSGKYATFPEGDQENKPLPEYPGDDTQEKISPDVLARFPGQLVPTNVSSFNAWLQRRSRRTNSVATSVREQTVSVAAAGAPLRILYGRQEVGAKIVWVGTTGSGQSRSLVIQAIWGLGEVDEIEEVKINGDTRPTSTTVVNYLGTTSQGVDPTLANNIDNYSNTMVLSVAGQSIGVAYSVVHIPDGVVNGFPRLTAVVKGRKVYDPRDGAQDENDSSTWKYSDNPSLCLADFETSTLYGRGKKVDWTNIEAAANANDELVNDNKRRTLNLAIEKRADVNTHVETLARYAGVFVNVRGGATYLVPDRPKASSRTLTASDIQNLRLREPKLSRKPTVVTVTYTDKSGNKTRDSQATAKLSGVEAGTTNWREQVLRLPGIDNFEEAYRYAVEELNAANIVNLEGDFVTRDEGLLDEVGDVQTLTHPRGLFSKEIQIVGHEPVDVGRWRLLFVEYDEDRFSDEVISGPNFNDTELASPFDVPDITGLAVVEEVYQTQSGIYASRLRATWDATDYLYSFRYEVQVWDGSKLIWSSATTNEEFSTGAVQENIEYQVKVRVTGVGLSANGNFASYLLTAQGKTLIPGDVPQVTATQISADSVLLQWQEAIDIDIWRYRVKHGTAWASASEIDLVDGLQLKIENLAAGSQRFLVKAVDSIRQESANAAVININLDKPSMSDSLTGFEVGGEVRLNWGEGAGFVRSYIVRFGPQGFSWANGTTLDNVNALRLVTKDIAAGTWDFVVRAQDFAGNVSEDESRKTLIVTTDADAFLAGDIELTSPTLTNMDSWSHRPEGNASVTYVTEMDETPASLWPNAMSTYTEVLATYHASGSTEWLSETHDFGTLLTGNWSAKDTAEALSGDVTTILELSEDNSTWTQHTELSAKISARYARVRIQASTTSTLKVTTPGIQLLISIVAREETHDISYKSEKYTVEFDGDNDHINISGTTGHPVGNADFTVDGWVFPRDFAPDRQGLLSLKGAGTTEAHQAFIWEIINGQARFFIGFTGAERPTAEIRLNKWNWYRTEYRAADRRFRVWDFDKLVIETTIADQNVDLLGGLEFCLPISSVRGNCLLNDIRYWDTLKGAPTLEEIFSELDGTEANLVGNWKLNDGTGATATDSTANNNHGTLINGPQWTPRGYRVLLNDTYSSTQLVSVSPLGTNARTFAVDHIKMGDPSFFEVFIFNSSTGARVDNEALVTFKGV